MKAGEIILTEVPLSDGTVKMRPALLIARLPGYGDWLVAGISSQITQFIEGWDQKVSSAFGWFPETGLKLDSIIRLSFLAIIPDKKIAGSIGNIPGNVLIDLKKRLGQKILE